MEHWRLLGRSTRKWLPNQKKPTLHVTSKTGLALRDGVAPSKEPDDGIRVWDRSFANLWAGKEEVHQTAWASTQRGSGPIPVRDGFLQGACEAPVAFALALRVALTEFDDEIRKQGVQFTTELEYCAYVGDINGRAGTVCHDETQRDAWSSEATTHSLLQTPEITATIREEMTQFVKGHRVVS